MRILAPAVCMTLGTKSARRNRGAEGWSLARGSRRLCLDSYRTLEGPATGPTREFSNKAHRCRCRALIRLRCGPELATDVRPLFALRRVFPCECSECFEMFRLSKRTLVHAGSGSVGGESRLLLHACTMTLLLARHAAQQLKDVVRAVASRLDPGWALLAARMRPNAR